MPRFFVDAPPENGEILITGDDAWHIGRSLRSRIGDNLTVCCEKVDYLCKIVSITAENVKLSVQSSHPSAEPNIDLRVFVGLPKLDKLELVAQKCTELGATEILPVLTKFCVSRPEAAQFAKKRERLQKIVNEAAKQSGRGILPQVSDILSFNQAVLELSNCDLAFVCYEHGGKSLSEFNFNGVKTVGVFTGAEGGFDEPEIEACKAAGIAPIWLGNRILRCETAPIAASSIIMNISGNM